MKFFLALILFPSICMGLTKKNIAIVGLLPPKGDITNHFHSDYKYASELALDVFNKKKRSYVPSIDLCFERGDQHTPNSLISDIAKKNYIVSFGFSYSREAILSSYAASVEKIPFVTPTASHSSFYEVKSDYASSLGLSHKKGACIAANFVKKEFSTHRFIVLTSSDSSYERDYLEGFTKCFDHNHETISFLSSKRDEGFGKLFDFNIDPDKTVLVIPAYHAMGLDQVKKILEFYPKVKILLAAEWVYSETLFREHVNTANLYAVADYFNRSSNKNIDWNKFPLALKTRDNYNFFHDEFFKRYKYKPRALTSTFYDGISILLELLDDPNVIDRKTMAEKIKSFDYFCGVNSVYTTKNKELLKPAYILRWEKNHFRPIIEVSPSDFEKIRVN